MSAALRVTVEDLDTGDTETKDLPLNELRKDDRVRAELAPLYRDDAGHEAWVQAFSETDDER